MATPTQLAVEIWGEDQNYSRSPGSHRVRKEARELFPDDAPGQGGEWDLTGEQAVAIRRRLTQNTPQGEAYRCPDARRVRGFRQEDREASRS